MSIFLQINNIIKSEGASNPFVSGQISLREITYNKNLGGIEFPKFFEVLRFSIY